MCEPQVFRLWAGLGFRRVQVVAKFASDGRTGSRVSTYLCTNRNLKFQGVLLVMCEPQVFGRAGGPRLGLNISLISIFLKSLNNVLIVLQYIQLLL